VNNNPLNLWKRFATWAVFWTKREEGSHNPYRKSIISLQENGQYLA